MCLPRVRDHLWQGCAVRGNVLPLRSNNMTAFLVSKPPRRPLISNRGLIQGRLQTFSVKVIRCSFQLV